jgi:ABC-2 type transport system permease protein
MKKDFLFFIAQTKTNIKNAHALRGSFWIGIFSMVLNNVAFFVIWLLFMHATGPINGWNGMDVFGMLGVSMICYGITFGLFHGVVELPNMVVRGSFDSVLLAPVGSFVKLSGSSFLITAYGDLLIGAFTSVFYGFYVHFSLYSWLMFLLAIICGCVVFVCIRLLASLVVFFIHDEDAIPMQIFEIFLRPSLYPGAIFPDKLKIFCMTVVPTLITSSVPIDVVKLDSFILMFFSILVTFTWVCITYLIYTLSVKRYESGNFLR